MSLGSKLFANLASNADLLNFEHLLPDKNTYKSEQTQIFPACCSDKIFVNSSPVILFVNRDLFVILEQLPY